MRRVHVGDFRIGEDIRKAVNEVLDSGRISEGKKVKEFEKRWAEFIGTRYSVLTSSGTASLIASLTALKYHKDFDIKAGQKVITSPLTYIAPTNALVVTGFKPIYVDVDRETFVITPENIKAHLEQMDDTSKYSFIMPIHLMGYPCDMDKINKIAKKYGLQVFEDSAQADGSKYKDKRTGSMGLLGVFSFYIAHNIQAGEMGAITTNDYEIVRLVNKIKSHGRLCDCPICTRETSGCPPKIKKIQEEVDIDPRFAHDIIGYNFRVMEFQAAIGLVQIGKVDWIIKRRHENVKYLNEKLEEFSDILQLPKFIKDISYLAYPLVIKNPKKIPRNKLRIEMEKRGVETRPIFGCIPTQQPAYSFLRKEYGGKLPNADYVGRNGFYVGCHQYLEREDLDQIVNSLKDILKL